MRQSRGAIQPEQNYFYLRILENLHNTGREFVITAYSHPRTGRLECPRQYYRVLLSTTNEQHWDRDDDLAEPVTRTHLIAFKRLIASRRAIAAPIPRAYTLAGRRLQCDRVTIFHMPLAHIGNVISILPGDRTSSSCRMLTARRNPVLVVQH